ncbi:phage tail tip lysozyme [Rhizobium ruizarguesonis]|uniref:phage tail tip lysozyme n=1 Tax=Rhizobium ruizarguesonis TaxID=2081791 RepID=UPI001444A348|nr:phage tail tip lysozyme [Rhizobium ruizarguesonis]NKQ85522.1 hypothetical protein [Rhizobium ruizarguesonis]
MAVVTSTRTLRRDPAGESSGNDAPAGARVEILEDTGNGWIKIRIPGAPGAPEGWVSALAVDRERDSLGAIDKLVFATTCSWDSLLVETSAHYLLAVAQLRSNIIDGPQEGDGDWGPFALNEKEWSKFSQKPELELSFQESDRKDWLAQCMVFAVMSNAMQKRVAIKLSDEPTVAELYLAQMVGASAAHAIKTSPGKAIAEVLAAIPEEEFAVDGITRDRARDRKYLTAGSGSDLVKLLEKDLQKALDDTRQFATQVSAQLLASDETRLEADGLPSLDINFNAAVIPSKRKGNAILIATRFKDAGYGSIQQIAAIANAIAESGLDETADGDNHHSHGLFQLNQKGGVGADFSTKELEDPERNIVIMLEHMAKQEKAADKAFRATTAILAAVTIFVRNFERPKDQLGEIAKRVGIAQKLVV